MARETINGISVPIPGTGEPADFVGDLRRIATDLPASFERGDLTRVFVHPTNGDDAFDGLLASRPKATIEAALAAITGKGEVILSHGTHPAPGGLTVDIHRQRIVGNIGAEIDCSAAPATTVGISFTSTAANNEDLLSHPWRVLENVEIKGPGVGVAGCVGMSFEGPNHDGLVHDIRLESVVVHDWETGTYFGDYTFGVTFASCVWWGNGTGITDLGTPVEAGERWTFLGCSLRNNIGPGAVANNPNSTWFFIGCSLNYNQESAGGRHITVNAGHVELASCHIETSRAVSGPIFALANSDSAGLLIHGGSVTLLGAGPNAASALIQNDAPATAPGVTLRDVFLANVEGTSGYLSTGTGATRVVDCTTLSNLAASAPVPAVSAVGNLLADGGMELGDIADDWFITQAGTLTDRHNASYLTLSKSTTTARTGSQALKVEKLVGGGGDANFSLAVPVERLARPGWRFYLSKPGAQTGNIYINVFAAVVRPDGNNVPATPAATVLQSYSQTFTSSALGWTEFRVDNVKRMPAWATHLVFAFNMFEMNAGAIYIDDFEVGAV